MAFFDKQSNYNKNANFSSVVIGADAPVLEVELNEMQQIQRERLRNSLRLLFSNGIKGSGNYTYDEETSILSITDELVILDGEILELINAQVKATEGDIIYVEVWEKIVSCDDNIHKYGNMSDSIYIENYLMDSRIGQETSRRTQVQFKISTVKPTDKPYLILGKIQQNDFTLIADNMIRSVGGDPNKDALHPHKYITLQAFEGRNRYNVYVSHKGELITELTDASTPLFPQIILQDNSGNKWTLCINAHGEITTKSTPSSISTSSIYLQSMYPYATIFKLGVNEAGEITTSPICDLDLIHDTNIGNDITWSSSKIAQIFDTYDKELRKLQLQVTKLQTKIKMLGGEIND